MAHSILLKSLAVILALALPLSVLPAPSSLAAGPDDEVDDMPAALAPQGGPLTSGRIVAIDRTAHQVEIEHAPIKEFYMQAMTMIFKVADPSLLYGLTPGDKIRFRLERSGRSYVITRIEHSN
ncbi:MAG: copper-binding protein [Proteobacteria bacterium]|nr:copper-binding protein [Pseudomonadota bacterium]